MWVALKNAPPEPGTGQASRYDVEEHDRLIYGTDLSPLGEDEVALASVNDPSLLER